MAGSARRPDRHTANVTAFRIALFLACHNHRECRFHIGVVLRPCGRKPEQDEFFGLNCIGVSPVQHSTRRRFDELQGM